MKNLKEKYDSLNELNGQAEDPKDLEKMLMEFKGIGPTTVNIFLRELRTIWDKADPEPMDFVKDQAKSLGINLNKLNRKTEEFVRLEAALIRSRKNRRRKAK